MLVLSCIKLRARVIIILLKIILLLRLYAIDSVTYFLYCLTQLTLSILIDLYFHNVNRILRLTWYNRKIINFAANIWEVILIASKVRLRVKLNHVMMPSYLWCLSSWPQIRMIYSTMHRLIGLLTRYIPLFIEMHGR
jgi:hypothetical protein